ncbi:uncharacterized protein LOC134243452 [Saccostrea cucullata]|uniref:uncharacterized protein LOC134243452 n=1 Tax=Saccostrea cuccullata TaxID=36930 RepID=UPI002ED29E4A
MKGILTLLLLFNIKNQVSGKPCNISIPTINYVISCPKNQLEWMEAASRKQCDVIARIQNCTTEAEFQYHCLVNKQRNETLEVCAPTRFLLGFCVDYDITLAKVTENYDLKCSNFTKPCPTRYISTDAYKYQDCYQLKYANKLLPLYDVTERNNNTTKIIKIGTERNNNTTKIIKIDTETIFFPLFLGVSIALVISILTIFFVIMKKRRWCYNKEYAKIAQDDPSGMISYDNVKQATSPRLIHIRLFLQ